MLTTLTTMVTTMLTNQPSTQVQAPRPRTCMQASASAWSHRAQHVCANECTAWMLVCMAKLHRSAACLAMCAVGKTREDSHAICTPLDESQEPVVDVPAPRWAHDSHAMHGLHPLWPGPVSRALPHVGLQHTGGRGCATCCSPARRRVQPGSLASRQAAIHMPIHIPHMPTALHI